MKIFYQPGWKSQCFRVFLMMEHSVPPPFCVIPSLLTIPLQPLSNIAFRWVFYWQPFNWATSSWRPLEDRRRHAFPTRRATTYFRRHFALALKKHVATTGRLSISVHKSQSTCIGIRLVQIIGLITWLLLSPNLVASVNVIHLPCNWRT
jgi:hypothetical protein